MDARAWAYRSAVGIAALTLTACLPVTVPGGSGGPQCPEGTYHVTEQVLDPLLSPIGALDVDALPGGSLTLTINASTWALAGSQSFDVSGNTQWGAVDGTAAATVDASGSWSKTSSSALHFALGAISGSVSVDGTVGGTAVHRTFTLSEIDLHDRYGLSGNADFACGAAPALTLPFSHIRLTLNR